MNNGGTGILPAYPQVSLDNFKANGLGEIIIGSNGPSVKISSEVPDVAIVKIEEKGSSTIIISNSTNILVTDIIVDGVLYFFKTPIISDIYEIVRSDTKESVRFYSDENFIYTEKDDILEISDINGEIFIIKPVEIFLNMAFKLPNIYYIDDKTYSVKKYYNNLKITFNRTNLKAFPNGKIIRVRNHSKIISFDSFMSGVDSLIISNLSIETSSLSDFKYNDATIDFINMTNASQIGPFIVPKNIIDIKDDVVMIEVFIESNELKSKQYGIDGDTIFSNTTVAIQPIVKLKIRPSSEVLFVVLEKQQANMNKRYCGTKRLASQYSSLASLYQDQTMISGTRSEEGIVQFNLNSDISRLTVSDLSVVDEYGSTIMALVLDDTIFTKSTNRVGIKYKDRLPGILV